MELQEFIETAIRQIVDGVASAQAAATRKGAAVNPAFGFVGANAATAHSLIGKTGAGAYVSNLAFDVAVTVAESTDAKGGGKVEVAGLFTLGGSAGTEVRAERVTRLQFAVPICLPEERAARLAADAAIAEETRRVREGNSQLGAGNE